MCIYIYIYIYIYSYISGFEITCSGNPGHGSRFIENTAVEKVVSGQ